MKSPAIKPMIKTAVLTCFSALVLVGCGSKEVVPPELVVLEQPCEFTPGVRAPEWYCNPDVEGMIAAVGEARPNPARDNNLQRTMAMASARDALAQQLEVKVQGMLTNWARTTGADDAQTYEANFENVSRQVTQQTLSGSRQINRWVAPDGTLVLHVGMSEQSQLRDSLLTSLRNEQALWQQFQSQQSLQELDRQINNAFQ